MTWIRATLLCLVFLFTTQCTHTSLTLQREITNGKESGQNCPQELAALGKNSKPERSAQELKGQASRSSILPPAEVKTLEPSHPENFSSFAKEQKIVIATYNSLNLKESVGRFEPDVQTGKRQKVKDAAPKSQHDIDGVATAIHEISPDIVFLQEIEGEGSLNAFAQLELKNEWRPLIIHGNDTRGIQIGVLVKDSLPLRFEYQSHRDEPFSSPNHPGLTKVFSRDFPVLIVKTPNSETPVLILAGVHGKSKRSENIADPESREVRTAQAEKMVEIIKHYQEKHPNTPIMLMGDFNAEVASAPEYQALRQFNLKDAFDLSPNPVPSAQRVTHTYHPKDGDRVASQLDSILLAPPHHDLVLNARIYRYKNPDGSEKPIPQTYDQRKLNPSDHFPVYAEFDLQKILNRN